MNPEQIQRRQWTMGELQREVLRRGFEIMPGGRHAHHVMRFDSETGRHVFVAVLPGHKGRNVPTGTALSLLKRLRGGVA